MHSRIPGSRRIARGADARADDALWRAHAPGRTPTVGGAPPALPWRPGVAPGTQAVLRLQRAVGNAATATALRVQRDLVQRDLVQRDLGDDEALAAVDTLPAHVLSGGGAVPLRTEAQKRHFLRAGAEWFGSHEATLAHFSAIERCGIPGGPFMHRDAKRRLEAVAGTLGGPMPSTTVGFAFRAPFTADTRYTGTSMHTLGYAIDYDATNMPRVGRGETAELIRAVTGQSSNAQLGEYSARRGLIDQMGDETEGRAQQPQQAAAAESGPPAAAATPAPTDPRAAQLLDQVQTEADRLSRTSQEFQASLGAGRDAFLGLRTRYFEAQTPAERAAVLAEAPPLVAPWTSAVDGAEQAIRARAVAANLDPAALPTLQQLRGRLQRLDSTRGAAQRLRRSLRGADPRPGAPTWRQLGTWESQLGLTPAADAAADARLEAVVRAAESRRALEAPLLGAREQLARLASLRRLLADPTFLFGSPRTRRGERPTTAAVVNAPSMAQLLERGFFNPRDPRPGSGQFGAQFMVEMARHGFDLGAAWSGESTDSMHFELIVQRPAGG